MNGGMRRNKSDGRRGLTAAAGVAALALGALMLAAVAAYYAYSANARASLDDLNFAVEQDARVAGQVASVVPPAPNTALAARGESSRAVTVISNGAADGGAQARSASVHRAQDVAEQMPPKTFQAGAIDSEVGDSGGNIGASDTGRVHKPDEGATLPSHQQDGTSDGALLPLPPASFAALYPATRIHPKFWAQPLWASPEPYLYAAADPGTGLPPGFRAASARGDALARGEGALTTRIAIPLIGVDSAISELAILDVGNSREYETPKNLVGHIPQSPNPGELGNAWYFGHLESPIKGEGSVFKRLPEIPDLLRDGDDVFVELDAEDGRTYLYKVSRTEVMHQDELRLYDADSAQLTLVACVPRLVYDHRIVVTADLVGVADGAGAN